MVTTKGDEGGRLCGGNSPIQCDRMPIGIVGPGRMEWMTGGSMYDG